MPKTYLDRVKSEFTTDPRAKQPISQRTRILRDATLAVTPKLCPEQARLYTESWKKTEGQPLITHRVKAFEKGLTEMSIFIRPGEIIIGNQASEVRAAPVFPEFRSSFILDELDGKPYRFDERPGNRFRVSKAKDRNSA